jgi:hypothetical protein
MVLKKLYVVVNRELSPSYRAVQAGHAVAEYLLADKHNAEVWKNHTLVYLLGKNIVVDLKVIESYGLQCYPFYEPDLGGELTAFSCYSDNQIFTRFSVM